MDYLKTEFFVKENFFDLLDALLIRGYYAYQQYLNFGKKFFYAIIIKENNMRIAKLIVKHNHLFPVEQKNDLMLILSHINSWCAQWEYLYKNSTPNLEDEFIFETLIKFPKESLVRLDKYYFLYFNKKFTK